jgi:hypothetical protein
VARVRGEGDGDGVGEERESAGRGRESAGREGEVGEGAIALFLLRFDRLHLPYIYSPYRTCVLRN